MISFENFFKDIFDDEDISFFRLRLGAEDHLARLVANNGGGLFTALLVETETAYNIYFGDINDIDLKLNIQKSKTSAKNNLETTFLTETKKLFKAVEFKFIDDKIIRDEFFPAGLTEYNTTNDSNRPVLMERLRFLTDKYKVELGQPTADLFLAIKTNYGLAVSDQLQKIAIVATERTERNASKKVLTVQLTRNAHFVGYNYSANVDRCMDFFDESKFLPNKNKKVLLINDSLTENEQKEIIAPEGYTPKGKDELTIAITSAIPTGKKVIIYFGNDPMDVSLIGKGITADGTATQTAKLSKMGYAANKKLYAKNLGTGEVEFEIEIVY